MVFGAENPSDVMHFEQLLIWLQMRLQIFSEPSDQMGPPSNSITSSPQPQRVEIVEIQEFIFEQAEVTSIINCCRSFFVLGREPWLERGCVFWHQIKLGCVTLLLQQRT